MSPGIHAGRPANARWEKTPPPASVGSRRGAAGGGKWEGRALAYLSRRMIDEETAASATVGAGVGVALEAVAAHERVVQQALEDEAVIEAEVGVARRACLVKEGAELLRAGHAHLTGQDGRAAAVEVEAPGVAE